MKNTPIELPVGSLTMCDVKDFRDTLKRNHTVVTLCKYPPTWHSSDDNDRYHYYFRYYNADPEVWATAALVVFDLIQQGRDVLLHCVHGKDRTGGVAYAALRLHGYNHDDACDVMKEARPKMRKQWDAILEERKDIHEAAYEAAGEMIDSLAACEDLPWWTTYFAHEARSEKGIPIGSI